MSALQIRVARLIIEFLMEIYWRLVCTESTGNDQYKDPLMAKARKLNADMDKP